MNTKHYPYSLSELDFLTNKTCLFLLQQFQIVFGEYQKILKTNTLLSTTKPKPKSKNDKKDLNIKFITMDDIDERVLPAGYHTTYPSIFDSYGIWNNITAFVKRLEAKDKDKLTKEDLEDDEDDENDNNDTNYSIEDFENIEINKKKKIELDLQNAIRDLKVFGNKDFLGVCEFEIESSILTSSLYFVGHLNQYSLVFIALWIIG
ncbi:hypothetical protein F8M41_018219 [Gigaspora margarita]|uniref:Uncharacterized protein n=1 Tax=Gigaspora margarita TaxID=4874 RepID=A0A8H4ELK9_GIGMA|nr:hypothetical protein F8M41_018219 [Gigaspora margarita]